MTTSKEVLQKKGDQATFQTKLNNDAILGVTYAVRNSNQASLVNIINGLTSTVTLKNYPSPLPDPLVGTKIIIDATYNGQVVGDTTITLLPQSVHVINSSTPHISHYIYPDEGGTPYIDLDSIDLGDFHEAPGTKFFVEGNVKIPIIIPAYLSYWLVGAAGSVIDTTSGDGAASNYGVIVGNDRNDPLTTTNTDIRIYENEIKTKKNGIYFSNSVLEGSNVTLMNNNVSISAFDQNDAAGILFNNDISSLSTVNIANNTIAASSANKFAYGINFSGTNIESPITIDCNNIEADTIGTAVSAYGIYFLHSPVNPLTITGNTITIPNSTMASGVYFSASIGFSATISNNTISMRSSSAATSAFCGISFADSIVGIVTVSNNFISISTAFNNVIGIAFSAINAEGQVSIVSNTISVYATAADVKGIQFVQAIASGTSVTIEKNSISTAASITARAIIWNGDIGATTFIINNNTLSAFALSGATNLSGLFFENVSVPLSITNNTISVSSSTTTTAYSIEFDGNTFQGITISGNVISAKSQGVVGGIFFHKEITISANLTIFKNAILVWSAGGSSSVAVSCPKVTAPGISIVKNVIMCYSAGNYCTGVAFTDIATTTTLTLTSNIVCCYSVAGDSRGIHFPTFNQGISFESNVLFTGTAKLVGNNPFVRGLDSGETPVVGGRTNTFYYISLGNHSSMVGNATECTKHFLNGLNGAGETATLQTNTTIAWTDNLAHDYGCIVVCPNITLPKAAIKKQLQENRKDTINVQADNILRAVISIL